MLHSRLVYKYRCGGCNATYYDKTKHHSKTKFLNNKKKGQDWQQKTKYDPKAPHIL